MNTESFSISTMSKNDLQIAFQWAGAEGWNPGLSDAECFYPADPDGYFMGFLGDEPVGSISAVCYDDAFAFLGLYIVQPEYRGHGFGLKLWNRAIEHIGSRNAGLDGVISQQENYKKSGFQIAYKNLRFHGRSKKYPKHSSTIIPLSKIPFEKIVEFDKNLFPTRRDTFLDCWISQKTHKTFGIIQQNTLVGYSVLRPCMNGFKIGPLFADTREYASELFEAMSNSLETDTSLYLDAPEINTDALNLAHSFEMEKMFETVRMYNHQPPQLSFDKIFGITTFELG